MRDGVAPTGNAPVIAFAGGGPSATLTAIALLRATTWLRLNYRIVLIDSHGRHARGSGYTAADDRPLDAPVKAMSALPDRPCHLLEWVHHQGMGRDPGMHLPCRVYGDYLAGTLAHTAAWAKPHATLQHRSARVLRAVPAEDRVELHVAGGQRIDAAAAIVATGDPAAESPPDLTGEGTEPSGTGPRPATCPCGALIAPSGEVSHRLYAVGPVRREQSDGGPSPGISDIRNQAEQLAQRIADTVLRIR